MPPSLAPQARPEGEILHEITRSICPECRAVIDAQVLLRDGQVYMRKRCDDHGWFEGLIYADARAYVDQAKYNKPGQAPARISTEVLKAARWIVACAPSIDSTPAWHSSKSTAPATSIVRSASRMRAPAST